MLPTLIEQYRRWFQFEKDAHRQVLASLDTVPEANRGSEPYRKALNLMGHLVAARRMWLHRFEPSHERPAAIFPTDVDRADLPAAFESMERDWDDYLARLTEGELERVLVYQTSEGDWYSQPIVDSLTQLYGHSHYHRGQIASLVRACGGEPAKSDFIFWVRKKLDSPPPRGA